MVMCVPCSIAAEKTDKPSKKYWAYQKPQKPAVPQIEGNSSPNPIDAFIAAGLKAKSITPNPAAEPGQLLRRLSYDLTGLPPTQPSMIHSSTQ